MTLGTLDIRPAVPDDLPALTELYNHYIATTAVTFDLEPWTVDSYFSSPSVRKCQPMAMRSKTRNTAPRNPG